jgi:hypothetical protein
MPKVYIASRAEHVEFERVCSNCEHKWTASFDVGVRSYVESSQDQASESAKALMYEEKKDRRENREVLCPQCSHFSVDAMYRHFRKGGYAAGILKKYKRAVWMSLLGFVGFVWLPALLFFLADLNALRSGTWLSILWLIIVVGLGGLSFYKLIGFIWGIAALLGVKRKVSRLSDDQLLDLAVSCYKGNKNSLDSTILDEIRWNAWLSKPLFFKPSPASSSEVTQ